VKINSGYLRLVEQIKSTVQLNRDPQVDTADKRGEQKEISNLLSLIQQELTRLEKELAPERAAKLQELAKQIEAQEYNADASRTAAAMLQINVDKNSKG